MRWLLGASCSKNGGILAPFEVPWTVRTSSIYNTKSPKKLHIAGIFHSKPSLQKPPSG
jgi:hypothetical protein